MFVCVRVGASDGICESAAGLRRVWSLHHHHWSAGTTQTSCVPHICPHTRPDICLGNLRETCGELPGNFREVPGNIQETFGEPSANLRGTLREPSENVWETFGEPPGNLRGTFRKPSGNLLGSFGEPLGNLRYESGTNLVRIWYQFSTHVIPI